MIAAVRYGGTPPLWVSVLEAAEKWGVPPWTIAGGGTPLLWLTRWAFLTNQKHLAENNRMEGTDE